MIGCEMYDRAGYNGDFGPDFTDEELDQIDEQIMREDKRYGNMLAPAELKPEELYHIAVGAQEQVVVEITRKDNAVIRLLRHISWLNQSIETMYSEVTP